MLFLPSLALALNKTIKLCLEKKITDNYHNLIQKFVNVIYVQFTYYKKFTCKEKKGRLIEKSVSLPVHVIYTQ